MVYIRKKSKILHIINEKNFSGGSDELFTVEKFKFSFGLVYKVPEGAILGTWFIFEKNPKFYILCMKIFFREDTMNFLQSKNSNQKWSSVAPDFSDWVNAGRMAACFPSIGVLIDPPIVV